MRLRGYSERTIDTYVTELSVLSKHYGRSPSTLSHQDVKDFCYYLLQEKKLSNSTINQVISAWKILQVDVLSKDWEAIKIKRPRIEKRLPEVLSQAEAQALIISSHNLKHRILMQLTYATGMRCGEVLNLKLSSFDSSRMVVRIKGKGNKTREVPISLELLEELRLYYKVYRPNIYIFEGKKKGKPYSSTSFRAVLNRAGLAAGLKKNIYPHILRHSFATHMLERGMNLKRLQLLMGHSSINTTSGYLHLTHPYEGEVPNLLASIKEAGL